MKTLNLVEVTGFGAGIKVSEARVILVEHTPGFFDVVIGDPNVGGCLGSKDAKETHHTSTLLMGLGDWALALDLHDFQAFLWWIREFSDLLELEAVAARLLVQLVSLLRRAMDLLAKVPFFGDDLVGDEGARLTNRRNRIGDKKLEGGGVPPSIPLIFGAVCGAEFRKDWRSRRHVNLEGIVHLWELEELVTLQGDIDARHCSGLFSSCHWVIKSQNCSHDSLIFKAEFANLLSMPPFSDKKARPFSSKACIKCDGLKSEEAHSNHTLMYLRGWPF